jgi:2-dehydro-3-deoxygluconokinase
MPINIAGRVATFGEIMMRLSPPNNLRLEQTPSFDVRYGGAEANVALSLAYQGDDVAYISVVPNNRIGDCALRSLTTYGVDVSRVVREGDRLGTYFFEVGASVRPNGCVYDRKYSAISLAAHTDIDWKSALKGVNAFYFSGVTPAISDEMALCCKQALLTCHEYGITTICDLNYRGRMWSPDKAKQVMSELLPMVDICIANDEDAPSSLGITHGSGSLSSGIEERDSYVQIAADVCRDYGCSMVASVIRDIRSVEDSDWMSMVYVDGMPHFSAVHHVHVLEGVAAGDAYAAGLIHGLLHSFDFDHVSEYGIAASVLKLTIHGDSNLVKPEEIEAVAEKGSSLRVGR